MHPGPAPWHPSTENVPKLCLCGDGHPDLLPAFCCVLCEKGAAGEYVFGALRTGDERAGCGGAWDFYGYGHPHGHGFGGETFR